MTPIGINGQTAVQVCLSSDAVPYGSGEFSKMQILTGGAEILCTLINIYIQQ